MLTTLLLVASIGADPAPADVTDVAAAASPGRTHDALRTELESIASASGGRARLSTIGTSLASREIWLLTLSGDSERADERPAILVVAGMDGTRGSTTEMALGAAKALLEQPRELLDQVTVYLVPRANPDAAESFRALPGPRGALTTRPVDEDRDRRMDEDGPRDLNGDGVITLMRQLDPRPGVAAPTLVADEKDPRILREPQRHLGEVPRYAVWVEGLDADGDGLIAEDGAGGVDPDLNFPFRWPEFDRRAGAAPLSEPESLALARFVIAHPRIFAVETIGRHDNVVNVPDVRGRDQTGRQPLLLDEGDQPLWNEVSKAFKETTGLSRAGGGEPAGSFGLWTYVHRGLPSIATTGWGRPDAKPEPKPDAESGAKPEAKEDAQPRQKPESEEPGSAGGAKADAPAAPHEPGRARVNESKGVSLALSVTVAHDEDDDHGVPGLAAPQGAPQGAPNAPQGGPSGSAQGGGPGGAQGVPPGARGGAQGGPGGGRGGMGGRGGRGGPAARAPDRSADRGADRAVDPESAAWLEYSDRERGGSGFVAWAPFDHPTLGKVEIGGFVPGFRENPPADAVESLSKKHAEWLVRLAGMRPKLEVRGPSVEALAPGLVKIDLAVVNTGRLPIAMTPGKADGASRPLVMRVSAPLARVKSGRRVDTARSLDPGARIDASWIVDASEPFDVIVAHPILGEWSARIEGGAAAEPVLRPGSFSVEAPIGITSDDLMAASNTLVAGGGSAGGSARPPIPDPAWNRFYDMDETTEMLKAFAAARPDLATLEEIGKSVEGRPIWLLTVTNSATGSADTKPAMYVDGSIHANEIQATETVLYSIWYLLKNHGKIPALTDLLDRAAFYFVPVVNPDGRAGWFREPHTPSSQRTGRQPTDDDGDGLVDEDPSNDLNGDHSIGQMWRRDPIGTHRRNLRDPRILEPVSTEPRPDGTREYGEWSFAGEEGIDDDGDGRVNEDAVGSYDMNRNWPSDWQPNSIQRGAGPWPFFYPEARAIGRFLLSKPNLAAAQAFHNAGGMILRGPGANYRENEYPRRDVTTYDAISAAGVEMLPFYRPLVIWSGLYTVHGGLVNWLAEGLGVISFTNELWTDKRVLQNGADPTPEEAWRWRDRMLFGQTFTDWTEIDHPDFGRVLVGGGNRWSSRIPPGFMLEEECHRNFAFVTFHASQMPLIRWEAIETKSLGGDLWEVTVSVANDRLIPTRTGRAAEKRIGEPDRLLIEPGAGVNVIASGVMSSRHDRTFMPQAHEPSRLLIDEGVPGNGSRVMRVIVKGSRGGTVVLKYEAEKARGLEKSITLE